MTVIHTFRGVIEQLSLTIEIMVKCSHAGPCNKSVNSNAVLLGNYSHSGIELYMHTKIFFREKMTLVDWHNHDNRLDDNNQILLKNDLSVSCKNM